MWSLLLLCSKVHKKKGSEQGGALNKVYELPKREWQKMKGNLGIVSVHHIKLNEKFLQREKKTEEEEEAEEAIQRSKETLKKRGENGKKKKNTSKMFSLVACPS